MKTKEKNWVANDPSLHENFKTVRKRTKPKNQKPEAISHSRKDCDWKLKAMVKGRRDQ